MVRFSLIARRTWTTSFSCLHTLFLSCAAWAGARGKDTGSGRKRGERKEVTPSEVGGQARGRLNWLRASTDANLEKRKWRMRVVETFDKHTWKRKYLGMGSRSACVNKLDKSVRFRVPRFTCVSVRMCVVCLCVCLISCVHVVVVVMGGGG